MFDDEPVLSTGVLLSLLATACGQNLCEHNDGTLASGPSGVFGGQSLSLVTLNMLSGVPRGDVDAGGALATPVAELAKGLFLGQPLGFSQDVRRHPSGKGDFLRDVLPGRSVDLVQLGDLAFAEALGTANQCRPETTMNEGNSAVDKTAHENVVSVADRLCELEDLVATGMRPPTPADGLPCDGCRDRWHRAGGRLENNTVLSHEGNRLAEGHVVRPSHGAAGPL